jgi:ribosomal protein L29
MGCTASHNKKPDTFERPRPLTQCEIESLLREMKEDLHKMRAHLSSTHLLQHLKSRQN